MSIDDFAHYSTVLHGLTADSVRVNDDRHRREMVIEEGGRIAETPDSRRPL